MSNNTKAKVLTRLNLKLSSAFEKYLHNLDISAKCVQTLEDLTTELSNNHYSAVVCEISDTGNTLTKLLTRIKSISHSTKVIVVTDSDVSISEEGVLAQEIPLHEMVYAFITKPISETYLATLIGKAVERECRAPDANDQAVVLSASVDSLNSAVTITDINQNILYVNKAHEKMFGFPAVELMAEKSSILYPADDPSGVSAKIYEALLKVGWEGERLGLKKDGSVFPIYEKTSAIKDSNGAQIGLVSVIDDISSRKKLEIALKESEERYRTFVETAKSAIIAVDEQARVILYNPAAEQMFEYGREEVGGTEVFKLFIESQREALRDKYIEGSGTTKPRGDGAVFETKGLSKSGREFPVEASLSRCKINGRNIVTAIIFDVTEKKHMQEQIHQSSKLAAIGELVSGVTHEINNPLSIVIGYSEMMLHEDGLDAETKKAVESINHEAERAKKVIQGLLSFSRKHNPEKELIQINEVIRNTLSLVSYELNKNGINIIEELDPGLPMIKADPNQLQQVFMNLIINAEHAMEERSHDKSIKILSGTKRGRDDFAQIVFEDNGPGIPDDKLPKIFDPFYTSKPKGKGTGLGLSVSFGIIKEHGGDIYAENVKNGGGRFIIDLPIE